MVVGTPYDLLLYISTYNKVTLVDFGRTYNTSLHARLTKQEERSLDQTKHQNIGETKDVHSTRAHDQ